MVKALGVDNVVTTRISWRASWVCGEGWVDQVGSYDKSLDESC